MEPFTAVRSVDPLNFAEKLDQIMIHEWVGPTAVTWADPGHTRYIDVTYACADPELAVTLTMSFAPSVEAGRCYPLLSDNRSWENLIGYLSQLEVVANG